MSTYTADTNAHIRFISHLFLHMNEAWNRSENILILLLFPAYTIVGNIQSVPQRRVKFQIMQCKLGLTSSHQLDYCELYQFSSLDLTYSMCPIKQREVFTEAQPYYISTLTEAYTNFKTICALNASFSNTALQTCCMDINTFMFQWS